jgi:hypothetical protein
LSGRFRSAGQISKRLSFVWAIDTSGRAGGVSGKISLYPSGRQQMSFILYLIGFAFVIGGIAWALIVAKVSIIYVMIAVVILIGIAILTGVTRTRVRD